MLQYPQIKHLNISLIFLSSHLSCFTPSVFRVIRSPQIYIQYNCKYKATYDTPLKVNVAGPFIKLKYVTLCVCVCVCVCTGRIQLYITSANSQSVFITVKLLRLKSAVSVTVWSFTGRLLQVLGDKVKLYIYISTDSVYDVCDKNHSHPSSETDSVRPQSLDRQQVSAWSKQHGVGNRGDA